MDRHSQPLQRGRPVTGKDVASAKDYFEHFLNASSLKNILGYYRSICDLLNLRPNLFPLFYPKLRGHLTSWRAKALWKKFDGRAAHKCYGKGKLCANTRVLIIGAGPCGLRTAIEAQLLGAKVVLIEKRDRLSRNNVLHLWPFVIEDLRALGAKKFFGKFCAGAIDHISIRQLQCILLKVALLIGVEVHTEISFERIIEPNLNEKTGWKAEFKPTDHPVAQYEFDVIIGADGKRNTLQGFKRKEFRGKLAIAITANFINKRTEAEARVEEISGVAFIFNQKFFKELHEATGIDLENIVYYKDDTHYFVMTAKKPSLIEKGVIKQDLADTERLLAPDNVDRNALMSYACEAANFSTNYQMPDLEFAVNHYGQPDVAMFDFTSMYAAENASKAIERHGYRLLMVLVGDSLLEPFWPTGSGCARGFLSSMDAAWAIRSWCSGSMTPLDVIAERESIYRLLAQTTPDNLNKDWKAYTLEPATRYPNLNKNVVLPHQTVGLFDTDNPKNIERMRRNSIDTQSDVPKKRRRGNVDNGILLNWISEQIREHDDIVISDLGSIFKDGKVLCAILNHYRPDLLDYNSIKDDAPMKNNQLAIDILEKEIGIPPIMTGEEITNTEDYLSMATYLTQVYDNFRCEIPHINHPKVHELPDIPKYPYNPIKCTKPDKNKTVAVDKKFVNNEDSNQRSIEIKTDFISSRNSPPCLLNNNTIKNLEKDKIPSCIKPRKQLSIYTTNDNLITNDKINQLKLELGTHSNWLTICPKIDLKRAESEASFDIKICQKRRNFKLPCSLKMRESDDDISNEVKQNLKKVSKWIISNDFNVEEAMTVPDNSSEALPEKFSNTKCTDLKKTDSAVMEERVEVIKSDEIENNFIRSVKSMTGCNEMKMASKFSQYSPLEKRAELSRKYPIIVEGEESELPPEAKRSETTFKAQVPTYLPIVAQVPSRPLSRHKRHVDAVISNRPSSMERKTRKRRTLEKVGASVEERQRILEEIAANRFDRHNKRRQQRKLQTEQFLKSMQMLQANAKPDSQPFEDYSLFVYRQTAPNFEDRVKDLEKKFTYVPDHESKLPNVARGNNADEDFAARIKNLEDKWKEPQPVDKKPKDLMRAIGKIETSDWNIKEIEKKIRENKLGKPTNKDKEKVPKWSKEQFIARQTKMEKQHLDRQDSAEAKYANIDKNIKHLELRLKEGTARDLGQNKVASITEKLTSKVPEVTEPKPIQKSSSRTAVVLPTQGGSEFCHFCGKRVYLVERLSAEGRFFHHGCFKCQYCNTQLRLGSYAFDRDGMYGYKFFCIHHFGMQGEIKPAKVARKMSQKQSNKSPEKKLLGVTGVDLLDRVQTPERVEFSNLSMGNASSDHEDSLSQMDEDEWTDKNFGASTAELGSSDDEDSSSLSDTDTDDEDAFEEALEEPATKEGTLKWAERFNKRYSKKRKDSESDDYSSSDQSSYYENTSDDDDSDTATEGEEEIRARELRKQEVRVDPPVVQTDTGTDTEIVSDESSSESSSEIRNSATEISTDSEFAQDDPTPTREIPAIMLNDFHVTKTRGSGRGPKKIQVTSGYLQKPINGTPAPKQDIELKLTPLVPSAPIVRKPAPLLPRTEGYALNRTQSTGGIAAKVSLELKKKYLLGEVNVPGNIQKSGSASTLDTKLKSFHTNISDCQKLLKPAAEISASMQTFCNKLNERLSPVLSPQTNFSKPIETIITNKSPTTTTTNDEKELTNVTVVDEPFVFQNEPEGRPRSPVHETSIIVPKIDWSKANRIHSEDSLSEEYVSENDAEQKTPNFHFDNIPTVKVENAVDDDDDNDEIIKDDIPLDSLCVEVETKKVEMDDAPKSIAGEKKTLNQPKSLPNWQSDNVLPDIHNSGHHVRLKKDEHSPDNEVKSLKNSSGRSSPSIGDSVAEQATAALTETELSDWARDGAVSDDLEGDEFELNLESRSNKKPKRMVANVPHTNELMGHVCGKDRKDFKNKTIITEAMNCVLSRNLDNIEFMDTGTETSSDDGIVDSQNGYVLFKDEDELVDDSLNPNINDDVLEVRNTQITEPKNTGYCIIDSETNFGGEIIDLKPSDVEKLKLKQNTTEHEEDSLLIIEAGTGTTTEENTCSDSTVKNLTEITTDRYYSAPMENNNFQRQRLEEKLAKLKAEQAAIQQDKQQESVKISSQKENIVDRNMEFQEHCQRLQSKVEFGNVKDSIDIRKSRRKSKSESPQKPDLIQEEKERSSPVLTDITLNLTPSVRTPDILYKKEVIEKERDVNQKLIQEMVMNKMKAENKSLERKKRNRNLICVNKSFDLTKSATTDIASQMNKFISPNRNSTTYSTSSSTYTTPDVLLTTNTVPLQKSQTVNAVPPNQEDELFSTPREKIRPLSVFSTSSERKYILPETPLTNPENYSLPDIRKPLFKDDFITPTAPPRSKHDEAKKTAEKLKQDARVRARLLSNEELGLSPEDKLVKLREKVGKRFIRDIDEISNLDVQESIESLVVNNERRNSWLYSNDTLNRKRNSFRRPQSGEDSSNQTPKKCIVSTKPVVVAVAHLETMKICKSDPNLLDTDCKKAKKKPKDRERRKSITKLFTTLFSKKSPSSNSKGIFSRISSKTKDVSKSCTNLDLRDSDKLVEEPVRRNSFSEVSAQRIFIENNSPPPVPPLPLHYTGNSIKGTDESSDGEHDWKRHGRSSCDTLDQSGILDSSVSSLNSRRTSKGAKRAARQTQLKRHRMAQEIQRKLEETEVKTRELEERGVSVEKALRGEDNGRYSKEESELLQEWFDLMRDRTELRRYEKELLVRAQELELEDRHARLQHELRERLENNEEKTQNDVEIEGSIINEMMEIVAKRDSLIALLEEDRLRYSNEDRDFEEQMLAKGLRLTPIRKTPEK